MLATTRGNHWRRLSLAGLFVSLPLAICCHYYAAFLLLPFALAELTRTWVRRRIDWPIWIALGLAPFVVLIFPAGDPQRASGVCRRYACG